MSARKKLNAVFVSIALLVAATGGLITESWLVFVALAAVGTILMIHAGEVRVRSGDHTLTPRSARK